MRGSRRKGGESRRQETPQEARERMTRAAQSQGPGTPQPQPAPQARPTPQPQPQPTFTQPAPQVERDLQPTGAVRANGSSTFDAPPPPVERQEEPRSESPAGADAPIGELVKQLTDQTKTLVKQEMRLAQVELQEKGKKMGVGAGLFGAGGLVGFFGGAVLIVAIVLALDTAMPAWLAALIVAVVLLAGAGIAALMGKKQIEKATPPAPEAAMESVKKDVTTVKEAARS